MNTINTPKRMDTTNEIPAHHNAALITTVTSNGCSELNMISFAAKCALFFFVDSLTPKRGIVVVVAIVFGASGPSGPKLSLLLLLLLSSINLRLLYVPDDDGVIEFAALYLSLFASNFAWNKGPEHAWPNSISDGVGTPFFCASTYAV